MRIPLEGTIDLGQCQQELGAHLLKELRMAIITYLCAAREGLERLTVIALALRRHLAGVVSVYSRDELRPQRIPRLCKSGRLRQMAWCSVTLMRTKT